VEIRLATSDDILKVACMIGNEFMVDPLQHMEAMAVALTLESYRCSETACVFVAVEDDKILGCIAGVLGPYFYNRTHLMVREAFRRAVKNAGVTKLLITELEKWAKIIGANSILLAERFLYANDLTEYMNKLGYTSLEKLYIKEV
jgi:hypothetical protein